MEAIHRLRLRLARSSTDPVFLREFRVRMRGRGRAPSAAYPGVVACIALLIIGSAWPTLSRTAGVGGGPVAPCLASDHPVLPHRGAVPAWEARLLFEREAQTWAGRDHSSVRETSSWGNARPLWSKWAT